MAKELGVPYERLLHWCREAGMPYHSPDEEVEPAHVQQLRSAFIGKSSKEDPAIDWLGDADLDEEGLPQTLEELEELERSIFKAGPSSAAAKKSRDPRIPLMELLEKYGLEEKGILKKVRRLLPEDISRLFNHESLAEQQADLLRKSIEERIHLCCGHSDCRNLLLNRHGEKKVVFTKEPSACRICRGSAIRRGLEQMAEACGKAGIHRILVVGGAPASHKELKNNAPEGIEFKLIEGDVSRDKQRAAADMKWCDLAIIWAGTILGHGVSQNYAKGRKEDSPHVLVVKRRSVEALCKVVVQRLQTKEN